MFRQSEVLNSSLPSRAKVVYVYLCDRANKEGCCWPSVGLISRECNISRRTVFRAISELRENGYIATFHRIRKDGSWSSSMYMLDI